MRVGILSYQNIVLLLPMMANLYSELRSYQSSKYVQANQSSIKMQMYFIMSDVNRLNVIHH
jgi:hypothetical protein